MIHLKSKYTDVEYVCIHWLSEIFIKKIYNKNKLWKYFILVNFGF